MKVWKRSLPVWLLTLVMLLTACGTPSQPDQPDGTETWREAYEETGAYLQAQTAPTVGSIGGEWAVIGLSRARLLSDETAQSYEQTVEDYVKQAGSVRLHHAKSTENSRTILGLTAAGYNAANVAGVDLTAGLTDMAYLRAQGTNGPIWALIALDCHGYDTLSISWRRQRIEYILKNEKYKGDAILQKSYTTESFPRKRKNNHGERNAYYMEDSHAAIVSDVDFETVQKIRAGHRRSTGITNTVLRGTLYCCCESPLRMRMSGQSVYWVCIRHSHNASACPITQIPEVQIQQAFLQLYYNLKHQGSHILPDLITNLQPIRERKFLWSVDVIELNKQIAELTSQNQLLTTLRESGCVDPDIFISKSNALTEQLRAAKQAKSRILNQDGDDTITGTQELLTILKRGPETLHDFDGELFGQLIDKVIIESNTSLRFRLKNGLELRESIERTVR